MRALGVDRVRVYVDWRQHSPASGARNPPSGFDAADPRSYPPGTWESLDAILREAARRRIQIDLNVGGPAPSWALGGGSPQSPYFTWKPSARRFGAFVRALGTRYSGSFTPASGAPPLPRVRFWSIWNEPNYGPNLAPQAIDHSMVEVSPRLYRDLLDAAWAALTATDHAQDVVLIGETAPRGITVGDNPGNFSGMVPLRFIRALYCVGPDLTALRGAAASLRGCPPRGASPRFSLDHPALFHAAGFADHPYPQGAMAPNAPSPGEPDYADLASLPLLERTLDRVRAVYGRFAPLGIYSTEFGYQTNPPEAVARATPSLAATYLNWAEYISWRDPRVRSYDQYLVEDSPAGNFATGLEFSDSRPKPSFASFRLPIYLPVQTFAKGRALEVWGCVRPARYAPTTTGRSQVRIEFRPVGQAAFQTAGIVTLPSHSVYFDVLHTFAGTGSVRLAWSHRGAAPIYSRIVAITSR